MVGADFARGLEREIDLLKESRAAAVEREQKSRVECNRLRGEVKSWRECAEKLAALFTYQSTAADVDNAIAHFDELKKGQP